MYLLLTLDVKSLEATRHQCKRVECRCRVVVQVGPKGDSYKFPRRNFSEDTTWNFRPLAFSIYRFVERSRWILEKKSDDRELEHFRKQYSEGHRRLSLRELGNEKRNERRLKRNLIINKYKYNQQDASSCSMTMYSV